MIKHKRNAQALLNLSTRIMETTQDLGEYLYANRIAMRANAILKQEEK